jgi:hypothetical protein
LRKTPRETFKLLPATTVASALPLPELAALTDHQRSLIELGHYLAAQINDQSVRDPLLVRLAAPSAESEAQLAVDQFRAFLVQMAKQPVPQPAQKALARDRRRSTRAGARKRPRRSK